MARAHTGIADKPFDEITLEEFEAYEEVRSSGVTNMLARDVICDLAGINKETYLGILTYYKLLMEKFPGVRGG